MTSMNRPPASKVLLFVTVPFNQSEESTKNYISSKPGGVDGRGLGWPKLQILFHFIQDSFMIEMLIINMTLIKASEFRSQSSLSALYTT